MEVQIYTKTSCPFCVDAKKWFNEHIIDYNEHCMDNEEQASKLIDRHLIRDMRGNLRAYGQQKVRCPK